MKRLAVLAVTVFACLCSCMSSPILRDAPRPDPAVVAGVAAATAGVLSLLPGAPRRAEAPATPDLSGRDYPMTVSTENGVTVYTFSEPAHH